MYRQGQEKTVMKHTGNKGWKTGKMQITSSYRHGKKPKGHMKASHLPTNIQYELKNRMTILYNTAGLQQGIWMAPETRWEKKITNGCEIGNEN